MRNPFVPLFVSCLCGLLAAHQGFVPGEACASLAWLFFAVSLGLFRLRFFRWTYLVVVLAFTLLVSSFYLSRVDNAAPPLEREPLPEDYISIDAVLLDFPVIEEAGSVIMVRSIQVEFNRRKRPFQRHIRIRVNGDLRHLMRGDRVNIQARLSAPSHHVNFYPSPMVHYYSYKGIELDGYSKSVHLVRVTGATHCLWGLVGGWRNRIRRVLEENFLRPGGGLNRRGVLLEAILIGDRGRLGDSLAEDLKRTGVFHLFAISGAHIAIVALLAMLFLRLVGCPLAWRIGITIVLLMAFLILSGFRISAQRAVFMAVPLLLSRYFFYGVDVYNILSLSGIVILCFNPAEFLDPGFVLTFVLTAAIVAGRTVWDRFLHRMVRAVRELVSANLSASLVAIPLSLYYFKRYSFSGVLAGVILIPLTGVILMFGFTVVLAAPLSSALCTAVLKAADPFLCLFFALVDGFATHLDLTVFRASPPVAAVLAVPLLFFLLGRPVRFRFQKSLLGLMITVLLLWMVLPAAPHRPGNLTVFFLDVGHGDAAVVLFPSGRSLLIDGGGSHSGFQVGKRLVHPFLIQKRLRINWVAVSHYHPDHCRGIVEIVGILKPAEVWLSSASVRTPGYRRLIDALPAATRIRRCKAADVLWIDKCRVAFLHPPEFIRADRTHNNHSQVISISSPHHTFLFTGDAEGVVEAEISNRDPLYLKADVLKVPHHGSRTSSTARFLDEVRPRIALFSHSTHNRFHFPHPEVKQRYIDRGIGMLSTARHGGVAVVSTAGGLALTVSK